MNPISYEVGDKVQITPATLQIMRNGNRSIHAYPCDSFIEKAAAVVGVEGTVTHRFFPGFEMSVSFDAANVILHCKDSWVEKV